MLNTKHICRVEPIYGANPEYNYCYLMEQCKKHGMSELADWANNLPLISFDQHRAVALAIIKMRKYLHKIGKLNLTKHSLTNGQADGECHGLPKR